MADGQIYITIGYGQNGKQGKPGKAGPQGPKGDTGPQGEPGPASEKNLLTAYASHEMLHLIKSQTIKSLNSSIAMIGNLEGDYFKQMKIQEAMERASIGASAIMGAISGFAMSGGNPIGALIGAGTVIVGQGVSWAFERVNFEASMKKQNYEIELLRQRSGLNSLYDGSRGTED